VSVCFFSLFDAGKPAGLTVYKIVDPSSALRSCFSSEYASRCPQFGHNSVTYEKKKRSDDGIDFSLPLFTHPQLNLVGIVSLGLSLALLLEGGREGVWM